MDHLDSEHGHDRPPSPAWLRYARVRSDGDLTTAWRAVMGKLGFGRRSLWLLFLEPDGHVAPVIAPIDDVPARPDAIMLENIGHVAAEMCDSMGPGSRVAFLLSRPGRTRVGPDEHAWALGLREVVPTSHVLHVANDVELRQMTPDDLVAAE